MAAGTGDLGAATAAPPRARLVLDGRLLGGYIALKIQRAQVGQGGSFGLTSDQVNTLHWLMPLVAATAIIAGAGLLLQQFFLRWTQGQELRQALITIAL